MTTYDLTTFGEAQIRLTVPGGDRLSTCRELRLTPAGSEANVAGLLAQLGLPRIIEQPSAPDITSRNLNRLVAGMARDLGFVRPRLSSGLAADRHRTVGPSDNSVHSAGSNNKFILPRRSVK